MTNIHALKDAVGYISKQFPIVASGLIDPDDTQLNTAAARVIDFYLRCKGREHWQEALDAAAKLSVDFIRLHGRFLKTGAYRATQSKTFNEVLYSQPDKMKDYLDGLLFSYALWPNHVRIYSFFCERFLPMLPPSATIIEIGVGHGLMAATAMQACDAERYFGLDLSPSSLEYCHRMLKACGIGDDRICMMQADAVAIDAVPGLHAPSPKRRLICSEVLEHVEEPRRILEGIRRIIGPDGSAFVTTVANIDAEDHVFLFRDADHIRSVLRECGHEVTEELLLPLARYATERVVPINYAAIIRPAF